MSDWLEPLWNLFTPTGAQQKQQDNKQPSSATYSSFGRANTQKYKPKTTGTPAKTSSGNVNEFQPKADGVGLTQIDENSVFAGQTVSPDPRTQISTKEWESYLANMNVQPTSPTNSSTAGYITAIGIFFVAMIFLKMVRR
jgi:hypothetical protein